MIPKVKTGDTLLDNDTRNGGRVVMVVRTDDDYAYYHTGKRTCKIRRDRIFEPPLPGTAPKKIGYTIVRV